MSSEDIKVLRPFGPTIAKVKIPENLIREIRPNFLVKGGDYKIDEIIGSEFMDSINGQVVLVQFKDGYSSSNIINKIIKDNA